MKVCIIIGSGGGVSLSVARRFGRSGYQIGLISRNARNLEDLSAQLTRDGIHTERATADAGDPEGLSQAMSELLDTFGRCDVLIYNAAVLSPARPLDLTTDRIEAELGVNLLGAHRAVKIIAPDMIERGSGAILFTGGGLALEPFPEWTSLALGKAALRSLAICLFKDLSPKGVHVSVLTICGIVAPGGPFDPDVIAEEYWRVATAPRGVADREVIFQPDGTDPVYNDPGRVHSDVSVLPEHARHRSADGNG